MSDAALCADYGLLNPWVGLIAKAGTAGCPSSCPNHPYQTQNWQLWPASITYSYKMRFMITHNLWGTTIWLEQWTNGTICTSPRNKFSDTATAR